MSKKLVRLKGVLRKINTKIPQPRVDAIQETLKEIHQGNLVPSMMAVYNGGFHVLSEEKNLKKQINIIKAKHAKRI